MSEVEGWIRIANVLPQAKGIAFDGCHKIYILMDDTQMSLQKSYGYGQDEGSWLIPISADSFDQSLAWKQLRQWFKGSCNLRFIYAVGAVSGDPNAEYQTMIEQGY